MMQQILNHEIVAGESIAAHDDPDRRDAPRDALTRSLCRL
jgi:hypothetical protein